MMTPPFMEHNVIATDLRTLLKAALRGHDESPYAVQPPGIGFPGRACPSPRWSRPPARA